MAIRTFEVFTHLSETTGTTNTVAFNTNVQDSRIDYLVNAWELSSEGMAAGDKLYAIRFRLQGLPGRDIQNMRVAIKHTSRTTQTNFEPYAGFTEVFYASVFPAPTVLNEWVQLDFQTPFTWDGVSNISVSWSKDMAAAGGAGGIWLRQTSTNQSWTTWHNSAVAFPYNTGGTARAYMYAPSTQFVGDASNHVEPVVPPEGQIVLNGLRHYVHFPSMPTPLPESTATLDVLADISPSGDGSKTFVRTDLTDYTPDGLFINDVEAYSLYTTLSLPRFQGVHTSVTLEYWAKKTSAAKVNGESAMFPDNGIPRFQYSTFLSQYAWVRGDVAIQGYGAASDPFNTLNQWYHVALVYNAMNRDYKLFVDGVERGVYTYAADTIMFTNADIRLNQASGYVIASWRVYDRALSVSEVYHNFQEGWQQPKLAPPVTTAPAVTIVSVDKDVISDEQGMDRCTVGFVFDLDVTEWVVRAGGVDHETGTVVETGGAVTAGTVVYAYIDDEELANDGSYKISIYGRGTGGAWTPQG